jgi:hypothetical protein
LKYTYTVEVFRDKQTGACYTKDFAHKPIAVIDGPGPAKSFGVVLAPYAGPLPADKADSGEILVEGTGYMSQFGYSPEDLCQSLMVTKEQLASRFEDLGPVSQEVDLLAAIKHYEEEDCDFSNREYVLKCALRQLQRSGQSSHGDCILHTLIQDYQANTPK